MIRRMRGALPSPPHALAAAVPHALSGAAPDRFLRLPREVSYWGNRTDGCCVTTDEAFARAVSGVFVSEAEAVRWAEAHGVLNGAVISDVLDRMATGDGFRQDGNVYFPGKKVAVDYSDYATLCDAIFKGPVKLGVAADQLDAVVGEVTGWCGVGFAPDRRLDHCAGVCGYGPLGWLASCLRVAPPAGVSEQLPGFCVFTWRTFGLLDFVSLRNITGEAWLRSPTTMRRGNNPMTPDPVAVFGPDAPPPPPPAPAKGKVYSFSVDSAGVPSAVSVS
jgi:hypothetical protein